MSERRGEVVPKKADPRQLGFTDAMKKDFAKGKVLITQVGVTTVEESFLPATKSVDHKDREHAICGASGAKKWLACSGSVALCEIAGRTQDNPAAKTGTTAHELINVRLAGPVEHYNKTGAWNPDIHEMFDFVLHDKYPRDMFDNTTLYINLLIEMVNHYKPKKLFLEKKVYIDKTMGLFGTSDFFFAFKHEGKRILSVWDYKNGGWKIEATDPQLPYYGVAVMCSLPNIQFDEVWLNIVQPNCPDDDEEIDEDDGSDGIHRLHVASNEEMLQWRNTFTMGATKSLAQIGKPIAQLELNAGEHCFFCDAKGICPAFNKMMQEQAGIEFDNLPALQEAIEDIGLEVAQGNSSIIDRKQIDTLVNLIKHKSLIKKLLADADDIAINLFFQGFDLGELKVVHPNGRRSWLKDNGHVAKELKQLGIENPYSDKLRGLGSIEEELRKVRNIKAKEAGDMLQSLVKKSIPRYSLVSIDDPRPAATGNEIAALEFDEIPVKE